MAYLALAAAVAAQATAVQTPAAPRRLTARDGDVVVVNGDARVRIVRRTEGVARVISDAAERWVLILMDSGTPGGGPPDGRVDSTYSFYDLSAEWPLGPRWEGNVVLDDYSLSGAMPNIGLGVTTASGVIQLLRTAGPESADVQMFRDPAATSVVGFTGTGRSGGPGRSTFDEAEQLQIDTLRRNVQHRPPSAARPVFESRLQTTATPVRPGGGIDVPKRVIDVPPVLPERAREANVRGVVILEVTVAPDGSVSDARVLRSIPLLDAAALDAVKQWRFEPTYMNGVAVPVIITVPVKF